MSEPSAKAQIEAVISTLTPFEITALESLAERLGTTLKDYIAEIMKS